MNHFLAIFFLFFTSATTVFGYTSYVTEVSEPYEVVPLTEPAEVRQAYLGVFQDFPVMYEVKVEATTTLPVQLSQRYRSDSVPLGLALIVVRDDETGGGVTEVGRLRPKVEEWKVRKDSVFGMTFLESEVASYEMSPGTYRVEVSTPDNRGAYKLIVGTNDAPLGYFDTVAQVHLTQKTFDHSIFRLLFSSYVYYPLGILLLVAALWWTWRRRNSISHVV